MGKTLIVGSVDRYAYENIQPWLTSITKNAPDCDSLLVVYNMEGKEVNKVLASGLKYIVSFEKNNQNDLIYDTEGKPFNIVVVRFAHYWQYLAQLEDYDYVVITDVKDVIFQSDPTEWMKNTIDRTQKNIIVGAEWLPYNSEEWNSNNMKLAFGEAMYNKVSDKIICCAGVIAGKREDVADFCLNVYLMCKDANQYIAGGGGPDQAAMNLLLNMKSYERTVYTQSPEEKFLVHMGTTLQAGLDKPGHAESFLGNKTEEDIKKYNKKCPFKQPIIDDMIRNNTGEPYAIVHQWDRTRATFDLVKQNYKGDTK